MPMVSCFRGQDKPEGRGETFYPGLKCLQGQDTGGEGQDKLVHWFFNLFFNKN